MVCYFLQYLLCAEHFTKTIQEISMRARFDSHLANVEIGDQR